VIEIGRKKRNKARGKPKEIFTCQFCGKTLKTERGLSGHEKKCRAEKELGLPASLASETKKLLDIPADEPDGDELKEELARELERLKEEFRRQKEEEIRLESERSELAKERDELFRDMTTGKTGAASSILDPFGDDVDEDGSIPELAGPISADYRKDVDADIDVKSLQPPAKTVPKPPKEKPSVKPAGPKPDLAERTAELRKKFTITQADGPDTSSVLSPAPGQQEQTAPKPATAFDDDTLKTLRSKLEGDFEKRLARLEELLKDLKGQVPNRGELELKLQKRISRTELDNIIELLRRDINKIDIKVNDMGEEVGFGESLNVSKIPPSILESVYEATLADAMKALIQNIGPYDAETLVLKVLEDIRTQTSGSELFKYSEGKLRIMNLTRALESKAISAKQIQATYFEILKKILEYTPGYKPKNFRAMLKIKSQEFAIDKTSDLSEVLSDIRAEIDNFRNMREEVDIRLSELEDSRNELMSDVRDIWQKLNEMELDLTATPAEPAQDDTEEGEEPSSRPDSDEEPSSDDDTEDDEKKGGLRSAVLE